MSLVTQPVLAVVLQYPLSEQVSVIGGRPVLFVVHLFLLSEQVGGMDCTGCGGSVPIIGKGRHHL